MELEDVCSDLLALIRLYRLLQISGDDLIDPSHVILDDNAKLFLKKLLDGALEKVFGTHSKIRAAQTFIPNEPCHTPPIQPDTTMKPQPHFSQDALEASPTVNSYCFEDSDSHTVLLPKDDKLPEKKMPEATLKLQPLVSEGISQASPSVNTNLSEDSNSHTVVLSKYEELLDQQMPESKVPELSIAHIPPTKPKNTKKRCRSCQQHSIKQQNLIRAIKRANEKNLVSKAGNHQDPQNTLDQSVVGQDDGLVSNSNMLDSVENRCAPITEKLLDSSSISLGNGAVKSSGEHTFVIEMDKKLEVVDHLSEEITAAIKQIKSRLQDLRPTGKDIEPIEKNNAKSIVQIPAQNEGMVRRSELSPVNDVHQNQDQEPFLAASTDQSSQLGGRKDGIATTTISPHMPPKPVLKPTGECADFSNTGHTNSVKAMIEKIESMNRLKIANDHLTGQARKCVRFSRSSQGQESTLPTEMPNLVSNVKIEQYLASQNDTSADMQMITPPMQPQSLYPIDSVSSNKKMEVKDQLIMNLTLTGCNSSQISVHPSLYDDHINDDRKRGENMHATTAHWRYDERKDSVVIKSHNEESHRPQLDFCMDVHLTVLEALGNKTVISSRLSGKSRES